MKIIYLASGQAILPFQNVIYQDILGNRDIDGDMMNVDLGDYDILVATPPCNYYSKLNRHPETSVYSQKTKHLLPEIIKKFSMTGKPYIIENVRSQKINDLIKNDRTFPDHVIQYGRHTYWTNIPFNPNGIDQSKDFKAIGKRGSGHIEKLKNYVQGGKNVNDVISYFIDIVSRS